MRATKSYLPHLLLDRPLQEALESAVQGSNKAPASLALHVIKIGPKHACTKTKEQI